MFGVHISIKYGIPKAVELLKKLDKDANVMQIFVDNPHSSRLSNLKKYTDDNIKDIQNSTKNIKLFIHSPYVINLAKENINGIKLLIAELEFCEKINGIGVIVHMGKFLNSNREDALNMMKKNISNILKIAKIKKTKLLLETSAGQGTELCYDLVEFSDLYKLFTTKEKKNLGICIDTCHIYNAGYDLSTKSSVKIFIKLFDKLLGWKHVELIHLNNSQKDLGSRVDRHDNLSKGKIKKEGLMYFIKKMKKIPIVLETPSDGYKEDLKFIKNSL